MKRLVNYTTFESGHIVAHSKLSVNTTSRIPKTGKIQQNKALPEPYFGTKKPPSQMIQENHLLGGSFF
jgi:hypothetical protein